MAYVNTNTIGSFAAIRDRLAAFLATAQDNRARAAVFRRTVRELNQLTDRELTDLGISRIAIDRIAREAAYGA